MSYSFTVGPMAKSELTADTVRDAIEAEQARVADQLAVADPDNAEATGQAMADQADRLVEAIAALAQAVGPDDARLHVAVSGHANADHVPTGDWAPDAITLSISHTLV